VRGAHTFKAGGTLMLRDLKFDRTQIGKGFYFYPDATEPSAGRTGFEVAEMLIGTTSFTATGQPGFVRARPAAGKTACSSRTTGASPAS